MNGFSAAAKSFFAFAFFAAACALPAQEILNPIAGDWANRQFLVLEEGEAALAYYSLDGSDPEASGLAYDGPVLLDVAGDIQLKVVFVFTDGKKTSKELNFSVHEAVLPSDRAGADFVKTLSNGIYDYRAGSELVIPSSVEYGFGRDFTNLESGRTLSIPEDTVLERYVPLTIKSGGILWRFVLHTLPAVRGTYSRRDVPFEIRDWDTVVFTDKKMIYKIDGGWWTQPDVPIKIDRAFRHKISWQGIDYEAENPVQTFVLPPKPKIKTKKDGDGSSRLFVKGAVGYRFGVPNAAGQTFELYDAIRIDTFEGDNASGTAAADVFYDSVYQGKLPFSYNVNRQKPAAPVFVSSAENGFSRGSIALSIESSGAFDIFAAVAGPVILDNTSDIASDSILFDLNGISYKKLSGKMLTLKPSADGRTAYKVFAYAEDANGNKSRVSEYGALIDTYNYYIDGGAASEAEKAAADGTKAHPYSSFDALPQFINKSKFSVVHVKGKITMPGGQVALSSNCRIEGAGDAELILPANSSIVLRNANLAVSGVIISKQADGFDDDAETKNSNVFQIQRGVLELNEVEVSALFARSGTVINAENSVVMLQKSGITARARVYSSAVDSTGSKISVLNSRIAAVAETAVNFSAQGGIFELRSSECSVSGALGRIAELFDTHSSITDNSFKAELTKSGGANEPVFRGKRTLSVEYSGNTAAGF
ncbi:MAG: chitobiase/beta-hexosaminidase C-terminal domain-containing protein [Treponema sp.]